MVRCSLSIIAFPHAYYSNIVNLHKATTNNTNITQYIYIYIEKLIFLLIVCDIFNALRSTKTGKACEVDELAAEHFINAGPIIHVYLSMLFNCFITHGYLPEDFMKTTIVPIIKYKTGDLSNKGNYRPGACPGGPNGPAPPLLEIEKQKKRSSEQILSYFTYILLLFESEISFYLLFFELGPP